MRMSWSFLAFLLLVLTDPPAAVTRPDMPQGSDGRRTASLSTADEERLRKLLAARDSGDPADALRQLRKWMAEAGVPAADPKGFLLHRLLADWLQEDGLFAEAS